MAAIPTWLLRHQVTIEAYSGAGAYGPVYAAPVTVKAFVNDQQREIRQANGEVVVASAVAYCPPGTVAPPESRVTLPSGRKTRVINTNSLDSGGMPAPDHVELNLM